MKRKILSTLLVVALVISVFPVVGLASSNPSSWAENEIVKAKAEGLVTDSVTYNYQANITREQFCELVILAYEKITGVRAQVGNTSFNDTYNKEILKAANLGIVTGYGNNVFGPNDLITREQIATMLVRMIDKSVSYENINVYNDNYFKDKNDISSWALPSVNFAYDKGIMQGVGNNCIAPQANTTCEQAVLLVYRTVEKYYNAEAQLDSVYELTEEHIAQDNETFVHYTDNIILAFIESGLSEEEKEEIAHVINGDIVAQLAGSINLLQIEVKNSTLDELQIIAEKLMKSNEVNYASPDIITNKKSIANTSNNQTDMTYEGENEWWFNVIEAQDTWNEYGKFINTTTVGVIDSVINTAHEDLKNKVSFANDYYDNYNQINLASETNSALQTFDSGYVNHGTMISGIIAANRNDIGITGISNKSDIVFAAFSPNEKKWNSFSGDLYALKQILNNQDIKVVNFSLQNVYYDKTHFDNHKDDNNFKDYETYSDYRAAETKYLDEEAKEYAAVMCELIRNNREILVVQSAGNGVNNAGPGVDARFAGLWTRINNVTCDEIFEKYDIDYDEIKNRIMIVGAVENKSNNNIDYTMTSFSNHGKNVIDICAPGHNILSCNSIGKDLVDNTWVDDYYSNGSGTSEAAPMVTGTAAILWGIAPTLTAAEVKDFILEGSKCKAIGVGVDEGTEYPMLNVRGAVEELLKTKKVAITVGDKDTNGRIQDATVSYGNGFSETTDIIGCCDIYLLDNNHEITISKEGYKTVTVTVEDKYIGQDGEWADVKEILLEKDIDYANLVTDAYNEEIGEGYFAIPQINLKSTDCERINSEIWDTLYNGVVANLEPEYIFSDDDGIRYEWNVANGILSLLIEYNASDWSWTEYYVYNIDISDGTSLSNDEVISAAGFTATDYTKSTQEALGSRFWSGWERDNENFYNQYFVDTFNTCLKNTLSDENINNSIAYLNDDGQLCVVAKVYSMAGAEYYWNTINLSDYQLLPNYSDKASLLVQKGKISENEAKAKLEEWLDDLGTWVAGEENVLVCDGIYECNGKEYYQFRLKGWVFDHTTTLTLYVISADGTEMFEGECSNGYLDKY